MIEVTAQLFEPSLCQLVFFRQPTLTNLGMTKEFQIDNYFSDSHKNEVLDCGYEVQYQCHKKLG